MKHVTRPCRLLAPDLPCFGDTPPDAVEPHDYVQSCVAWLHAFLLSLRTTEPVVVVGTSMGGYVASHFAAAHPELVRHLVLLAPAGAVDKDLAAASAAQTQIVAGLHPLLPSSWEQYQDMVRLLAYKPLPLPMWMLKGLWNEAEPRTAVFQSILKSLVDSITNMQVATQMAQSSSMECLLVTCLQAQDVLSTLPDALPVALGWGEHDKLLPIEGASLLRSCKMRFFLFCRK